MKKLLTLRQASERTNLSIPSIRMRIFRRTFPFTKIGNCIRVEESELEKFIALLQSVSAKEAAERGEAA